MQLTGALAGALLLAVLVPSAHAVAAPSCDGRRATIVGTTGGTVTGTPGDDVIVAGGAIAVHALAGDDRVCIADQTAVDLGDGDDLLVVAGDQVDGDSVDGGGGHDRLDLDQYRQTAGRPDWVVDDVHHVVTRDTMPVLQLTGIEDFFLRMAAHDVTFLGDATGESVAVDDIEDNDTGDASLTGTFSADMGAGDDTIDVPANVALTAEGGPGEDRLVARGTSHHYASVYANYYLSSDYIHVDLTRGTLKFNPNAPAAPVAGFEDATAVSDLHFGQIPAVVVVGTSGPNRLEADCGGDQVELLGRGGDDELSAAATPVCDTRRPKELQRVMLGGAGDDVLRGWFGVDRLRGGPGADQLYGGPDGDQLDGGPGHDRADGGRGTDTCRAEQESACER